MMRSTTKLRNGTLLRMLWHRVALADRRSASGQRVAKQECTRMTAGKPQAVRAKQATDGPQS
eukprot:825002-Pyramimonas_sp.AAC.1